MSEHGPEAVGVAGKRICGAKTRGGTPCKRAPAIGRERCSKHGGKSPRGIFHYNYQGKGYSKDLPTRLAERLQKGLDDPNIGSLKSELALLDARIQELLAELDAARTRPEGELGRNPHDVQYEITSLIDLKRRVAAADTARTRLLGRYATEEQMRLFIGATFMAVASIPDLTQEQANHFRKEVARLLQERGLAKLDVMPTGGASS